MLQKMLRNTKNRRGFTLVEIIVVAVIVAILVVAATPIYLGYVSSSKVSEANSIGSSCANYLSAARISESSPVIITGFASIIASGSVLSYVTPLGDPVTYMVPLKATIATTGTIAAGGTVICTYDGKSGAVFSF